MDCDGSMAGTSRRKQEHAEAVHWGRTLKGNSKAGQWIIAAPLIHALGLSYGLQAGAQNTLEAL